MTPVDEKKPDLMPFERHPRLAKILQHYATHSTGCSQLQWQELLDSINEAITTPAQRPTDKDAQEALQWFNEETIAMQHIGQYGKEDMRHVETIRRALSEPSREATWRSEYAALSKICDSLYEAFGMFLNGMAYYTTFPDNDEDAKQLSNSATREFMRAERHISEELKSVCRDAHKELITKEHKPQMDKLMEELNAK